MIRFLKIFTLSLFIISCGGGGGDGDSGGGDPPPAPTPPGNPTLTSPANNTVCETGSSISDTQSNVTFTWQSSSSTNSYDCLLYTSPSPRDRYGSRMPSSA